MFWWPTTPREQVGQQVTVTNHFVCTRENMYLRKSLSLWCNFVAATRHTKLNLGGVYMRKHAPVPVSYRDGFLISYCVYMMTGSFHISLFKSTLHIDKKNRAIQNRKHYACATHSSLLAARFHTKTGLLCIYLIPLWDFVPEWNSRAGTRTRVNSLELAWHFVVVSCKQIKSYERELEWTRSGAKVAAVSCKHSLICFNIFSFLPKQKQTNCKTKQTKQTAVSLTKILTTLLHQ